MDGGGINKFIPSTETFVHYPDTWGDKMVSITGFTPNELLVSAFSKGIFIFDKKTGKKRPFAIMSPSLEHHIRYSGQPINLYRDTPNSILILSSPPYRYHTSTRQLTPVPCAKEVKIKGLLSSIGYDSTAIYLNDPMLYPGMTRAYSGLQAPVACTPITLIPANSKEFLPPYLMK